MEHWRDQGIILNARAHGERGRVVTLLTRAQGRHAGYVYGSTSGKAGALIEPGTLVAAEWHSRVEDGLGTFSLEPVEGLSPLIVEDPLKLSAILSALALCESTLPEREAHPALFDGLRALIHLAGDENNDFWAAGYVLWEISLLKELGFSLDLTRCVAGGSSDALAYVSPKSGCAVSLDKGEPYRDKLLALPEFLKPVPSIAADQDADLLNGLILTHYFLEHWAFVHHTRGMPEARRLFQERFTRYAGRSELKMQQG